MLNSLARVVIRRPVLIVAVCIIVVVVLGAFIPQTQESSGNEAFAPDTPELAAFTAETEIFGATADILVQVVVGGQDGDDVVSPQGLADVRTLTEQIMREGPVDLLASDASRPPVLHWFTPAEQALAQLGRAGQTPEAAELDALVVRAFGQLPAGVAAQFTQLTSGDDLTTSRTGIVLVRLDRSKVLATARSQALETEAVIDAQRRVVEAVRGVPTALDVQPFALELMLNPAEDFQREVGRLFLLAFSVIAAVLLFVFRLARNGGRPLLAALRRAAADMGLAMAVALLASAVQQGAGVLLGPDYLGLIGYFSPPTRIVPILLVALGVDYAIHLQERYRDELTILGPDEATRQAITRVGPALALASVTTAIGFLTNVASPTPAIADLGALAAIGLLAAFVFAVTLFPAARLLLDRRAARRGRLPTPLDVEAGGDLLADVGAWFAGPVLARPVTLLVVAALLAAAGGVGLSQLRTAYDFTDFVPEDSPLLAAFSTLQEEFGGGVDERTTVLVRGPGVRTPAVHNALIAAEQQLATVPQVALVEGRPVVTSFSSVVSAVLQAGGDGSDPGGVPAAEIPAAGEEAPPPGEALAALAAARAAGLNPDGTITLDGDVGAVYDALRTIVPALDTVAANNGQGDLTAMRLTVSTPISDADTEVPELREALTRLTRPVAGAGEVTVDVTSQAIVQDVAIRLLSESQLRAIVTTLVAVAILLIAVYGIRQRRPILGVLIVIPVVCTMLWTFGIMYLLGLSFDPVTSTIAALVVGIGIDYVIHLAERFTQDLEVRGTVDEAMTVSLTHTGGALTASAVTTGVGFAVLTTASLPPFVRLGIIITLAIALSLISSLTVVAPLLVLWARRGERRSARRRTPDEQAALEDLAEESLIAAALSSGERADAPPVESPPVESPPVEAPSVEAPPTGEGPSQMPPPSGPPATALAPPDGEPHPGVLPAPRAEMPALAALPPPSGAPVPVWAPPVPRPPARRTPPQSPPVLPPPSAGDRAEGPRAEPFPDRPDAGDVPDVGR